MVRGGLCIIISGEEALSRVIARDRGDGAVVARALSAPLELARKPSSSLLEASIST